MKIKALFALVLLAFTAPALHAQGTLVYDQQSSTDENYPYGGGRIQFWGTVGQSFTPSLTTVAVFRVKVYDITPDNALGATLVMNLRAGSMTGTILSTTTPVVLNDGFAGSVSFYLPTPITVTPSATYVFETVVQSGDDWGITIRSDSLGDVNYPGGAFYGGIFPFPGNDLWFREGTIVPEPTTGCLLLVGGALVGWARRRL